MNQELKVRGNVVVLATAPTISGLSQLHDSLELVECGIDAMPTDAQTSNAAILVVEVDPAIPSSMDRVAQLSQKLDRRVRTIADAVGDLGEARLLLIAALALLDEAGDPNALMPIEIEQKAADVQRTS